MKGYSAPWANFNIGEFQQYAGLKGDNVYGPKTHEALMGDLGKQYAAQYGYVYDPTTKGYLSGAGYSTPQMNPKSGLPTADDLMFMQSHPFNSKSSGVFKDYIDLSNLDLTAPKTLPTDNTTVVNDPSVILSSRGAGIDGMGNPLSTNSSNPNNKTELNNIPIGTALQLGSLLGKGLGVARRPEQQNLYLNNAPITPQTYNPQPALLRNQYAFNALKQNINNSVGDAARMSNLQQGYANKMRGDMDVLSHYQEMNTQAQRDYEARLAQRNAENNQYRYNVDQINDQNRAARNNAVRGFLTDIGNLGVEANNQASNKQAVQWLLQAYPDIAQYFNMAGNTKTKKGG